MPPRIYLDNAATSWPKPESVYASVEGFLRDIGAAAGRGGYGAAVQADKIVSDARSVVRALLGAASTKSILFTFNGTDALNTVIHGCLSAGDHVITTDLEHNSVLRPLSFLRAKLGIDITYIGCDERGLVEPKDVAVALRPGTRLVIVSHASNVTGAIQPVAAIANRLEGHEALFLVDAAQTVGHCPVDITQLGADAVAASGHKGMLGPLGTGVLYMGSRAIERVASFRQGGTGSLSEETNQPWELPDKYESGNLNVAGLAGLGAGCQYLLERGIDTVRGHLERLDERLIDQFDDLTNVKLFGPLDPADRCGVTSFCVNGYPPQDVAAILDASFGIQVRAGLHCAPRMHQALGTLETGGTVRVSVGPFNTESDIAALVGALRQL